jgi:O-antigen ligase
MYNLLSFNDVAGYLRDVVTRPLFSVLFALVIAAAVARSGKPEKFLAPILISIWVMSLLVIGVVLQSGIALDQLASDDSREFLSLLGMHANDLGRLYAIAYALLLFTWVESRAIGLKLMLLASMGVVVVALMLTFSRGAFLGFIVVNVLFVLWRLNLKTLLLAMCIVAVALFALPDAVYDRVASGYGNGWNAISAGRIDEIWLPLLPDFLRNPVFGSGLASILWSEAMRVSGGDTVLEVTQAHSAYLETLLDMGIVGLVLLCSYFAHVWKGFRALGADPAVSPELRGFFQGAAAGLAGFLIAGIAGSYLTPRPEQVFLWVAIGMMYGQKLRNSSAGNASSHEGQAEPRIQQP